MRLTIGLLHSEPGWETILDQIGVSWSVISADDLLTPENFSIIIVNAVPTTLQTKNISLFIASGGSVLSVAGCGSVFTRSRVRSRYASSIIPSGGSPVPLDEMIDIFSTIFIEHSFGIGQCSFRSDLYSIVSAGKGTIAAISLPIHSLVTDRRAGRKNFYAPQERLPSEVVSNVSKGPLRRFLTGLILHLHRIRQLPFLHKWYFPGKEKTIFTFRIDSDKGNQQEIDALYALGRKYAVPITWFLDVRSHEGWLDHFKSFSGQEICLHCYSHETADSFDKNLKNFSKGSQLLRAHGISFHGGAAPFGMWNEAVSDVFEQLGFGFSSEFFLDYDNLPSFPCVHGRKSPVLQLPIHPICVGSLRRSRFTSKTMIEYFRHAAELSILRHEPLCFYHHPTHHELEVIENIFSTVRQNGLPTLSFSEFARWWKFREAHSAVIEYDQEKSILSFSSCAVPVDDNILYWRIVTPDLKEAFIVPGPAISLSSLKFSAPDPLPPPPADISRIRKFDFRHLIINSLNAWYRWTQ